MAAPITEPTHLASPQFLIDFNALSNGAQPSPVVFPGVSISGSALSVIDVDGFGAATSFPAYVSDKALGIPQVASPSVSTFTITFDVPVWQVGFGMFDTNFPGNLIRAYDILGNLLETTAPDALFPPGGSGADYVGFVRSLADIARIEITPGVNGSVVDALWIDNLAFSQASAPATLGLLGMGLLGMLASRRSRTARDRLRPAAVRPTL